jgi:excinuclease ABC subunit A
VNAANESDYLIIKGAREHNLKNISVRLPKKKLIVVTGVSGSGKSSLAFDTLFAEGQRRYVESLSAYARQFIGQLEKPRYDTIKGLSPTISIEQKAASTNPRSTVGTITEIYDYLRVLYARVGVQFCQECGKEVGSGDPGTMVRNILNLPKQSNILILSPIILNRKGEHRDVLDNLQRQGYVRARIDGEVQRMTRILEKNKKHTIEAVVDRLIIKDDPAFQKRLTDSVETALKLGKGDLVVQIVDGESIAMSESRTCCGIAYPELDPTLFSFNSPRGMCTECNGLGTVLNMDAEKIIPDDTLTLRQGAVVPWRNYFEKGKNAGKGWGARMFIAMEEQWGLDYDTPWRDLPQKEKDLLMLGSEGREMKVRWESAKVQGNVTMSWEGLVNTMMRRYLSTRSEGQKKYYSSFMSAQTCPVCNGHRLKLEIQHVKIADTAITDLTALTIGEASDFIQHLKLDGAKKLIAEELTKEIGSRLRFLINVGLNYLSLERKGPTLSGGESQRIRLASQIGSELTGVLYILDEPSIGLHQKDNLKLLQSLCHLRDIGNTLIVVEHDQETIESADWILDMGPGAGALGGEVVAEGTPEDIRRNSASLTGRYLNGVEEIEIPKKRRTKASKKNRAITIKKAGENNLADIDVKIPLGLLVAVTGVSGAGKSTLINQILYPALARKLHNSTLAVGQHKSINGLSQLDKIINIDQRPIGRTPRSNPATYTKVFDYIRDLFSMMPESKTRGYKKGRFSFNVKGGRCEQCKGDGYIKVEMHFLADVFVPCETCKGKRFNQSTLEILYKGKSIHEILDLSVSEATQLFYNQPKIRNILDTLNQVGLGYIKLGQPATTLSGGEAQRIKLARELSKRDTGQTLYILDEPTTGLHFDDIKMLLQVLHRLVDAGNSIIVIEHNLDVIKSADWIIDLGPEGGNQGGRIIAEGSPEKVAKIQKSYTGQFLKKVLAAHSSTE